VKKTKSKPFSSRIKRRTTGAQEIVVPTGLIEWRLGQRVWFQMVDGSIEITPTPRGRRGSRRSSSRIRRGVRSITASRQERDGCRIPR
jgi:hypothetical protein